MPVIPALRRQEQEAAWGLLASQGSHVYELRVEWETLSQKIRRGENEKDTKYYFLSHTCTHIHTLSVCPCAHVCLPPPYTPQYLTRNTGPIMMLIYSRQLQLFPSLIIILLPSSLHSSSRANLSAISRNILSLQLLDLRSYSSACPLQIPHSFQLWLEITFSLQVSLFI